MTESEKMTELGKGIKKIQEEMRDIAEEDTANYLLALLENLRIKILCGYEDNEKKFKRGKITQDRLSIMEEQTFYFMDSIDYWVDTIGK